MGEVKTRGRGVKPNRNQMFNRGSGIKKNTRKQGKLDGNP